jgi:hypothetical protein
VRRASLAPGVALLTLGIEASRERVPLRNAYVAAGQRARVRANSGVERALPVASAPPGVAANREVRRGVVGGGGRGREGEGLLPEREAERAGQCQGG